MMKNIDDITYLISLLTQNEKLSETELEHLSDMLVRLSNEFPQS